MESSVDHDGTFVIEQLIHMLMERITEFLVGLFTDILMELQLRF